MESFLVCWMGIERPGKVRRKEKKSAKETKKKFTPWQDIRKEKR